MRLSIKSTFSLVCFIFILALALAAMPAMAQTIQAEWADDLADGNVTGAGWKVTIGGLSDHAAEQNDTPVVTYLNVAGTTAAAAGVQDGFAAVADSATTSEGEISAAIGDVIAVQVVITGGAGPATNTYQRVTFPAAGPGATLAATDLVLLPKLMKLTTSEYYVSFGGMVTVTFDFAAAVAGTNGAPSAPLHISDVQDPTDAFDAASWNVLSVSGTNQVTLQSTAARNAASANVVVGLSTNYAMPVDPAADGHATVTFDDTAPTITAGSVNIAAPSGFPTPADGVWNSVFILTFSASDDTGGSEIEMVRIDTDDTKLEVGPVGLGPEDGTVDGTEYLVRITPKADRVTTAGEAVVITIVPVDKSGNEGSSSTSVKLALKEAAPNNPPTKVGTIDAKTVTVGADAITVNVASSFSDTDALTYTAMSSDTAKATVSVSGSVVTITPVAMGTATITVTAADTDNQTVTQTIMVTVNAAPVTPSTDEVDTATSSAVITIQPESFVVVVRDKDATAGIKGLAFRTDVTVVEWSTMPDLERLFYTGNDGIILGGGGGGALILSESASQTDRDRTSGTVGISEIMWAIDANYLGNPDLDTYAGSQWIELHNLNAAVEDNMDTADVDESDDGVAKVFLSWKTGREITSDATITGDLANPVLDVVTNFFHDRPGNERWEVPGSNGASISGVNFVSMARKGTFNLTKQDGGQYNQRYTRTGGATKSTDGRNKDHWAASSSAYLRLRTTRTDQTDVIYDFVGTPGRVNTFSAESQPHIRAGRTSVASDNIIINEVGNLSGSNYDWIELLNRSGGEINLRNYMISIVTSNSSDSPLIQFPANDNAKVAAGAVFLILKTDPADDTSHPIAATGYNVDKSAEEQQPGTPNSPVRYKVLNSLNLPDDGKFVLIVRRPDNHEGQRSGGHNDKGVAETGNADLDKVVDVAGWDDNLGKNSYPNAVSNTGLWPLYNFAGPFTNRNAFYVNTVHRRQYVTTNDGRSGVGAHENKNQDDRAAFRDIGWTGVGYRRDVADNAMHGGTPGYPNGALHGAGGTITSAVYISEIMYADARNGSLPQWIELRNPSNTVGANLHNWRLTIINHADKDAFEDGLWNGKANASVLLNGLQIKPNGTVLITSRKGPRSEVHLADSEIFSLFPSHRGTFGMTNANSDVINPFGFRITLHANGHEGDRNKWQLVDDIGNLAAPDPKDRRGDNERFDMPAWMWPDAVADDGSRSSVARTNNKVHGLGDGKMASSWMLSSDDSRTTLIDYVYYGHTDDTSTPGQTVGSPLPVNLSFFRPELEDGEIVIRWTTESELDNAGFNIYRSDARDGEFKKVNAALIQGNGTTGERSTYKWVDESAKPGAVYYYQIEDVSFAGERQTLATTRLKGLISAKNKATTIWGEIKEVQ